MGDTAHVERWNGLGHIETLPERIQAYITGDITGIVPILGPGNYTGIRLSLTYAKMMAAVHRIPVVGLSLFDAYMRVSRPYALTVLTNPSRKGWGTMQLFQSNASGYRALTPIRSMPNERIHQWVARFQAPMAWYHFGDTAWFDGRPQSIRLDLLALLDQLAQEPDLATQKNRPQVPIYALAVAPY